MKIRTAEFVKSAFERAHWLQDGRPEIAFLGRSNVGKSSLLNTLLGRRSLARTSNTPGRTQSINYYRVNDEFYFVDLPGYGYAKVSRSVRQDWGKMARDYLTERPEIVLYVQLVDSRHPPSELDKQLYDWLTLNQKPRLMIATKSDKLSRNELGNRLKDLRQMFGETEVIAFSAISGLGKDAVWGKIREAVEKN
ncbi:MAG TPA: ribosome biogenesis GTP-binding protein YihA/YsxC [Pyrinomonadaceae bacterium]|nr:ribosome biogenesis GTP-binding protein YihA/YsxC [Pyrinomonadaceae bacterium]